MVEDSDFKQLLAQAQQGDRDAIGRIYTMYLPHMDRVTRYRLRKLGLSTVTTSADIRNSVFRHLLKPGAFDKITTDKHLRNFLLKACGNKIMDTLSKLRASRHEPCDLAAHQDLQDRSAAALGDPLEQAEELERIYSQLTPRERLLCMLRRGGCGWDEIAARLKTTPLVARQAFSRGFRRAQKLIRDSQRSK